MHKFGTDGVRGVAGQGLMTTRSILDLGIASSRILSLPNANSPTLLVGRDTRASGAALQAALTAGFLSQGWNVVDAGVLPTPAIARLVRGDDFQAGVVISASHNPWHDNGVKFFDSQGSKLSSETEHSIESAWESLAHDRQTETAPVVFGRSYARTDLIDRYREELLQETQAPSNHFPLHVIVDCAHGAATPVWSQSFFDSLGLKGSLLHTEPNGTNINQNCGATHLDTLTEAVLRSGADLGIAFDGDADRALFIDARGHEVDGDATLAILARSWIESEGSIPSGQVVATVMSNLGLETALRKDSISLVRTDVGDRHVAEAMKNRGSAIGGEQSGHIIVRSHIHPDLLVGDGTRTALAILKRMTTSGLSLQELASAYTRCPQVLVNVPVREKPPFDSIPAVVDAQNRILDSLQNRGRILLRYSGTEPIARVMLEGEDREEIEALASPLIEALHSSLGTAKSS